MSALRNSVSSLMLLLGGVFVVLGADPATPSAGGPPLNTLPPSGPGVIQQPARPNALKFDATSKHVDLKEGELSAAFVFAVTNISSEPITVSNVSTSCGCTAGRLPSYPWKLEPGQGGHVNVTMDLKGKFGLVTKTATVLTSSGSYPLTVSAKAPMMSAANTMGDRNRNLAIAAADRQAIFRNECASCHVQPAIGKVGKELYQTACGICHEAEHRAQMVPDLRTKLKNSDANYWTKWISEGRPGSLMPAFAAQHGGILGVGQIETIVEYLETDYKKNPPPSAFKPTAVPASAPAAGPASSTTGG
ncbi:MAG: DUF1573 domain-containing protein [Verrucomicrobiota bacterium]